MRNKYRLWILVATLAFCMGAANPALAAHDSTQTSYAPSAVAMGVDALIIRPVSLVATVVGTGLFIVSLPFSALGMNVGQAGTKLVVDPAAYTFLRPLGQFEEPGQQSAHSAF